MGKKSNKKAAKAARRDSRASSSSGHPLQNVALGSVGRDQGNSAGMAAKPAPPLKNGSQGPDGIPQSLARILRPAATGRWMMPNIGSITPQYIEGVLRGAMAGNHVEQWELFDLMLDTWPELAACQAELIEGARTSGGVSIPFLPPARLVRCYVNDAARLEIRDFPASRLGWLKSLGCFTEVIAYKTRLFVPVSRAAEVLELIEAACGSISAAA